MRSTRTRRESCRGRLARAAPVLAALTLAATLATAGNGDDPEVAAGGGDLAVVDLRAFEIAGDGAPRHLVRLLVENRSESDLETPWSVRLFGPGGERELGECGAVGLPGGRVAACELLVGPRAVSEGDRLEARLDRATGAGGGIDDWDGEPANDVRTARVNTVPAGGPALRIARWEVRPRVVHGRSAVSFRFSVEGAHLVWLLVGEEKPRLLAGHPEDGLVSGWGEVRVGRSGPLTLVARNSLGAFVHETRAVLDADGTAAVGRAAAGPADPRPDPREATVLPEGVYGVEENAAPLTEVRREVADGDWAAELERLRESTRQGRAGR